MGAEYVDMDAFGATLEQVLGKLDDAVTDLMPSAVREGAKTARDHWKANAPVLTGAYAAGVSYRVKGSGKEVEATIGNATMPGLAHLLEKGHAKVGGGYVPPRVHIAPAYEDAVKVTEKAFEELVEQAVGEAAS